MQPLHLLKCYEYLVTSSWPDQTNTILFAFLYYKVGRTSLILLFPVPSFGLKYLSQWVAERSCPACQCSPVTLQEQCMGWPDTSSLCATNSRRTPEAEHQGDIQGLSQEGMHSTGPEALRHSLCPKNGRPWPCGKHAQIIKNDINFQEQIIATPNQSQTKYFQANLYWKGIKSDHCRQLSETLNNEILL